MHTLTVGVTAVGSGIGQPILDSLRDSFLRTRKIGFEASAWAKGAYECDAVYRLPLASDPGYTDALVAYCRGIGVEVLIPGSDTELIPIAEAVPALQAIGCRAIVSSPACIHACRDKLALYAHLTAAGFPFVSTWTLEEARARMEELPYPVIVKPRGGSGSVGAQVLCTVTDWKRVPVEGEWVVQPYLMPATWHAGPQGARAYLQQLERTGRPVQRDELSIQVLVGKDGRLLGRFASVNRLKDGVVMTVDPLDDSQVWEWTDRFVEAMVPLGLRGPCNLQGRITSEGIRFFEANARFTGITHVRALMGYNEVEAALRHFALGQERHIVQRCLPQVTERVGLRQMTEITVPRPRFARFDTSGKLALPPPFERVVLTGATGYLGSALVQKLCAEDLAREIIAPVRDLERAQAGLPVMDCLHLIPWQLGEPVPGIDGADLVIHAAAVRPTPSADPSVWYRLNVEGTRQLVQAARRARVPYVLFLSSQSVYGTQQAPPWREEAPLAPETSYAHSKAAGEALIQTLADGRVHWAILRLGRLYGLAQQMRWEELPHRFASLAAKGGPLSIHGDGEQRVDLLHVRDAAEAVEQLLRHPEAWDHIYNVGGGSPVSINELAEVCLAVATAEGWPVPTIERVPARGAVFNFGMSIDRLQMEVGWRPRISVTDGMAELMRRAREQ